MADPHRPKGFKRLRELPVVGRAADWGMGPRAVSKHTEQAGARIAGLKVTESICPYCAVGCGQVLPLRVGGGGAYLGARRRGRRPDGPPAGSRAT